MKKQPEATIKKLYRIGLTGGIASGKSKLLEYLSTKPRIYTINLDLFGHAIYELNPLVVRNLATIFGPEVITASHNSTIVNRERLGSLVFSSESKLLALRQLVSPEIKRLMLETIREVEHNWRDDYDIIAIEGAVLIEAKTVNMLDELWVTTLDKEEAVQRIIKRNPQLNEHQARARVNAQITDEERLKYASFHYNTSDAAPFEQNKRLIEEKLRELRDRGILRKGI